MAQKDAFSDKQRLSSLIDDEPDGCDRSLHPKLRVVPTLLPERLHDDTNFD